MKSFSTFITELWANNIKKENKMHGSKLGYKPTEGSTHIGTLKNGDQVHHYVEHGRRHKTHSYFVTGKSGKTNIHLTTHQPDNHKGEEIGILRANKSSKGAHHLYQHLVTKHNKILVADDQSPGARKVWEKAGKHPQVNIHGLDGNKAIHAHPSEDEHYSSGVHFNRIRRDSETATTRKERSQYKKDIEHEDKVIDTKLVMHKK